MIEGIEDTTSGFAIESEDFNTQKWGTNYGDPKEREPKNCQEKQKRGMACADHNCHGGVWSARAMEEVDNRWSKGW